MGIEGVDRNIIQSSSLEEIERVSTISEEGPAGDLESNANERSLQQTLRRKSFEEVFEEVFEEAC
jgi:hypothetical protein